MWTVCVRWSRWIHSLLKLCRAETRRVCVVLWRSSAAWLQENTGGILHQIWGNHQLWPQIRHPVPPFHLNVALFRFFKHILMPLGPFDCQISDRIWLFISDGCGRSFWVAPDLCFLRFWVVDITECEPQVQFPTRGINAPPSTNITLLSSGTATQKVNMWTFEHYLDVWCIKFQVRQLIHVQLDDIQKYTQSSPPYESFIIIPLVFSSIFFFFIELLQTQPSNHKCPSLPLDTQSFYNRRQINLCLQLFLQCHTSFSLL